MELEVLVKSVFSKAVYVHLPMSIYRAVLTTALVGHKPPTYEQWNAKNVDHEHTKEHTKSLS